MAHPTVFVDGQSGTTGLRIRELLAGHGGVEVLDIDPERRRDPDARADLLRRAHAAVLCLPDDASRDAAAMVGDAPTVLIDASTAFRTDPGWAYGLPELEPGHRAVLASSTRIANPGCYPQTVVLGLRPLVQAGVLRPDAPVAVHALSGYTGGGKALIGTWEDPDGGLLGMDHEAMYAVERVHKHVPEMHRYSALERPPFFVPAVGPFATGMRVCVPLHASLLTADGGASAASGAAVHEVLHERYRNEPFVRVAPLHTAPLTERELDPHACDGTNRLELHVLGNPAGHVLVVGLLDNLGKGAAGSAVQNLNLALGLPETQGLRA